MSTIPTSPRDEEFRTSSYSSQDGECVEVARTSGDTHLRDSKNRRDLCLLLPASEMVAFLRAAPLE